MATSNRDFLARNSVSTLNYLLGELEKGIDSSSVQSNLFITAEEVRNFLNEKEEAKKEKLAAMDLRDLMNAIYEEGFHIGQMSELDHPDMRITEISIDDYMNEIESRMTR